MRDPSHPAQDREPLRGLTLPRTWRPRRTRAVCYLIAALAMTVLVTLAVLLPDDGRRPWTLLDRAALVAFGLPLAWFLHRHASVRVTADRSGLVVRNLFRCRRLVWGEVLAVRLHRGDPWAYLDLSDGQTIAAMGIQASEGAAAPAAARELAALVRANSEL